MIVTTREQLVRQIDHARANSAQLRATVTRLGITGKEGTAEYKQACREAAHCDILVSDLEAVLGTYDRARAETGFQDKFQDGVSPAVLST